MAAKVKRLRFVHLLILLPIAVMVDLFGFIPVIGSLTIGLFRMTFWIMDVRTKFLTAGMFLGLMIEALPGVSVLPGVTGYVLTAYLMGRAEAAVSKAAGLDPVEAETKELKKGSRARAGKRVGPVGRAGRISGAQEKQKGKGLRPILASREERIKGSAEKQRKALREPR